MQRALAMFSFLPTLRAAALLLALAPALPAQLQPPKPALDDAVYTAGLSTIGTDHRPYGFVIWKHASAAASANKSFAIYLQSTAGGTFTRQAIVTATSDVPALRILLARTAALGVDPAGLNADLRVLLRRKSWGGTFDATRQIWISAFDDQPIELKLNAALGRALQVRDGFETLHAMALRHPALRLALGVAWAGALPVAPTGVTIEVREWNGAHDGLPIGRVQLTPGQNPEPLTSPGQVVQIPDLSRSGDLNIKLRWAVPDDLRRKHLHLQGFVAFRADAAFAEETGLGVGSTPAQVEAWVAKHGGNAERFAQVNVAPVPVRKLFSNADVAFGPADSKTFFLIDDANRGQLISEEPVTGPRHPGFGNLQRCLHFVRAVDLLGRLGPASPLVETYAVRTLPPNVPQNVTVADVPIDGQRRQVVRWRANVNQLSPTDRATRFYAIYRDPLLPKSAPSRSLFNLENPDAFRFLEPIAYVSQDAVDENGNLSYVDTASEPQAENLDRSIWYAVCALSTTPFDKLFPSPHDRVQSAPSPPAFGVFRDRTGPLPPQGYINLNCGRLACFARPSTTEPRNQPEVATSRTHFRLRAMRRPGDQGVKAVRFAILRPSPTEPLVHDAGILDFPEGADEVVHEFTATELEDYIVTCLPYSAEGCVSSAAATFFTRGGREDLWYVANFSVGRYAAADFGVGGVLEAAIAPQAFGSAGLAGPETVLAHYSGPSLEGRTAAVRTRLNGGPWTALGFSVLRNGVAIFPHPGRQLFTPGSFEYAFTALPENGGGDCACLHTARPIGATVVEPVAVAINVPETTREWRIFRRVDDGDLSLVKSGTIDPSIYTPEAILAQDKAMPPNGALCRYYAQCFDVNSNPSPLTYLGSVKLQPDLAKPVVSPAEAILAGSDQRVRLRWFCPPAGVQRFRVYVLPFNPQDLNHPPSLPPGSTLTQVGVGGPPGPGVHPFFATYALPGQEGSTSVPQTLYFETPEFTAPSTATTFSAELRVTPNIAYVVWVASYGVNGSAYVSSQAQLFTWKVPVVENPSLVAWPARPLPPVIQVEGVQAVRTATLLPNAEFRPQYSTIPTAAAAALYPVVVNIGRLRFAPQPIAHDAGDPACFEHPFSFVTRTRYDFGGEEKIIVPPESIGPDTNSYILPEAQNAVLFRQTVNADGRGALVQVSPLRPLVAQKVELNVQVGIAIDLDRTTVRDPFIKAATYESGAGFHTDLSLTDSHSVEEGATYHYYLVKYRSDGEIQHVVDCGAVTIPETP